MDIARLKGRTIAETSTDHYGNETLILDDGTEIYSGDQGVFDVQLTRCEACGISLLSEQLLAGHNRCRQCLDKMIKLAMIERESRRRLAWRDTPTFAKIRAQIERDHPPET